MIIRFNIANMQFNTQIRVIHVNDKCICIINALTNSALCRTSIKQWVK